jgi:hypothetical protein
MDPADTPIMLGPDVWPVHDHGNNRISTVDRGGREALHRRARDAARPIAREHGLNADVADRIADVALDAAIRLLEQWEEWPGRAPWWRWLFQKRWSVYVQGAAPDDVTPMRFARFYTRRAAQQWADLYNSMLPDELLGKRVEARYKVRTRWDPEDNL